MLESKSSEFSDVELSSESDPEVNIAPKHRETKNFAQPFSKENNKDLCDKITSVPDLTSQALFELRLFFPGHIFKNSFFGMFGAKYLSKF